MRIYSLLFFLISFGVTLNPAAADNPFKKFTRWVQQTGRDIDPTVHGLGNGIPVRITPTARTDSHTTSYPSTTSSGGESGTPSYQPPVYQPPLQVPQLKTTSTQPLPVNPSVTMSYNAILDSTGSFRFKTPTVWGMSSKDTWVSQDQTEMMFVKCVELAGRNYETWSNEAIQNATGSWADRQADEIIIDNRPTKFVYGCATTQGTPYVMQLFVSEKNGKGAVLVMGTRRVSEPYLQRIVQILSSFQWS